MKVTRFVPAADGGSRFGEIEIRVDNPSTDHFGNTVNRSRVFPVVSSMVSELPEGMVQDWHPASRRQFVVVMSGAVEVETSDGRKQTWRAGEMFFADDSDSNGHRTRTVGGPARLLFLHLPADAQFDG
jgi:hypothetical protein